MPIAQAVGHPVGAAVMERAEAAFSAGDAATAATLLCGVLGDASATPAQRVQALSDLGVISWSSGRADEAEAYLLSAVSTDPGYTPALENLSALSEGAGDLVQAAHWAARAAESDPGAPAGWRRVAALALQRRRFDEAEPALARALALGDDVEPDLDAVRNRHRMPATTGIDAAAAPVRRALIVVDYFYPSVGGSERLAEAAGAALGAEGIAVDVATRRLPERTGLRHRGMTIHEIGGDPVVALQSLLSDNAYDAALIFSAPLSWPLTASLRVAAPRPRMVAVPCINAENDAVLRGDVPQLREYATLLAGAEVVGYSSHSGPDVRLCEDLGLNGVYVPNASEPETPSSGSPTAALAAEGPLLLMVANMWPEKNHLGLLRGLRAHPGDWRLAIIGGASPAFPWIADEVSAAAREDPRVRLLGPAAPPEVAAAMLDARALLLPSLAEATPLVLLEAMSHRLPWIATPASGAAHDHAGGLILPLNRFGEGIDFLLADNRAAATLGDAGLAHWRRCYTWEVMGPRYARLLRGEPAEDFAAPAAAIADTDAVRAEFYDSRPRTAAGRRPR